MNYALVIFLLAALAGLVSCCVGVYILAGMGWALMASGMSCFAIAGFIRKGLSNA